ncbi:MAG: hypothetical protein HQ557_13240 [Bacteroidetes bacterium]|nr:hypothetical protein [Bacteroidota bacterium]
MTMRKILYFNNKLILFLVLVISIFICVPLSALEFDGQLGDSESNFTLDIRSRSGSPLILEFILDDPEQILKQLTIETQVGKTNFKLPESEHSETLLRPFYEPGVYSVTLTLESADEMWKRELLIGFSEFIWGRDNFRFSNIRSDYWGILPYSTALFPWVEERFGSLPPEDLIMLLNVTYHIFNGCIGRCYAFSGSQVRYVRNPELLPRYYSKIYNIRDTNIAAQNEMNMLQNDIMYDHFIINGYDYTTVQELPALQAEITDIMERISAGELISIGYFNAKRHHSLLVYGFINDPASKKVMLITANNWGVEHNENLVSEAVVQIEVNLDEDYTEPRVSWINPTNSSYRHAEHFFAVTVKDEYEHEPEVLATLISNQHELLKETETALIIVEQARDAVLLNAEGNKTGRLGRSTTEEIDGVVYKRVDDTHLFEFPAGLSLHLDFTPIAIENEDEFETDCNVFVLTYPVVDEVQLKHSAVYTGTDFPSAETFTLQVTPDGLNLMSKEEGAAVSD